MASLPPATAHLAYYHPSESSTARQHRWGSSCQSSYCFLNPPACLVWAIASLPPSSSSLTLFFFISLLPVSHPPHSQHSHTHTHTILPLYASITFCWNIWRSANRVVLPLCVRACVRVRKQVCMCRLWKVGVYVFHFFFFFLQMCIQLTTKGKNHEEECVCVCVRLRTNVWMGN